MDGGHAKRTIVTLETRVTYGLVLGNKIFLVKDGVRLWFSLKVNKHVVCEVTAKSFSIKTDHNISLILTKCSRCLKIIIK